MDTLQRTLVVIGLAVVAVSLHVVFFEWSTKIPDLNAGIFSLLGCELIDPNCLKLFYDTPASGNQPLAVFAGVILPIILFLVAAYFSAPLITSAKKSADEPGH